MIRLMETLSAPLPAEAERAHRIGRVKFMALPLDCDPVEEPQAATSSFQRFLQAIRAFASRVDGRPKAARP